MAYQTCTACGATIAWRKHLASTCKGKKCSHWETYEVNTGITHYPKGACPGRRGDVEFLPGIEPPDTKAPKPQGPRPPGSELPEVSKPWQSPDFDGYEMPKGDGPWRPPGMQMGNRILEELVEATVRRTMKQVIDELGIRPPPRTVIVQRPDGARVVTNEVQHTMLPTLVNYLARREHVYLYGPPGSGKTFGAVQAARLLGLPVAVMTAPGLSYGRILGMTSVAGEVVPTALTAAFEAGGVVVLDELDRATPQVASALNSLLENRRAVFGRREVVAHPDWVVVGTGNTDMRGGTRAFTGAQPLDYATADRFAFLAWDYDEVAELEIVAALVTPPVAVAICEWRRAIHRTVAADRLDTIACSPRSSQHMALDVRAGIPLAVAADARVFRGVDPAVRQRLLDKHPLPKVEIEVKE